MSFCPRSTALYPRGTGVGYRVTPSPKAIFSFLFQSLEKHNLQSVCLYDPPWRVCSMNGRDLGVAFVGFDMEGLFPACSMNVGQAALFNFGHSPFLYTPPTDGGGLSFRPVLEAVAGCASVESTRPWGAEQVGEDQAEAARDGRHAHGDTHELTPRGIRARNAAVAVELSYDEGYTEGGENEDNSHLELERQGLVENLIGMGFPVEWAVRAAERSGE